MGRTLTTGLSTHLLLRAFLPVDLYEIVVAGTTYRYTTHGTAITGVAPATVASYSPGVLQAGTQRQADGLEADDLEVMVLHGGSEQLGGKGWVARALDGDLDGASFKRFEGFLDPAAGTLVGCVLAFQGDVSPDEPTSTMLRLVVSVPGKRFNAKVPGLVCQPGCVWDFASPGCGFAGTKDFTATLAAGSTLSKLYLSALPGGMPGTPALGHFAQGYATLGGTRRTVALGPGGTYLVPSPPFPTGVVEAAIGTAGALGLRLGCDKTVDTCSSATRGYLRIASYLGAPWAPASTEAT